MIETRAIRKIFPASRKREEVVAVDSLDLLIEEGEIFGLLGPNGAGKTTTVRILLCLIRPTEGTASVAGYPIDSNPQDVRRVSGAVFETAGIYERLTAVECLDFFGHLYGMNSRERKHKIEYLLKTFDLWDRKDERLGKFSKGMKQKVNIARALIHDPKVLFLDEPTAGLDPAMTEIVWEQILKLRQTHSVTTMLCTHNLDEADRLCTRVAIIKDGRIVGTGTPTDLKNRSAGSKFILRLRRLEPDKDREKMKELLSTISAIPGVKEVSLEGDNSLSFVSESEEETNPAIIRAVVAAGGDVVSLEEESPLLKDVYLKLIGKS